MEEVLGTCVDRGIKVVTNAGGLNPAGLADQVRPLADRLGLSVAVAHVEGDDLLARLGELRGGGHPLAHLDTGRPLGRGRRDRWCRPTPTSAAWPIAEALAGGADVVVCPRVTDASLVVGPAAWHHGWARDRLGPRWPGRWRPATSSSAAPRPPGATTPSSPRCPGSSTPASPSPRWRPTGRRSSPSTRAPAARSRSAPSPPSSSTRSAAPTTPTPTWWPASTPSSSTGRARPGAAVGRPGPARPRDVKVSINLLGGWRNTMTFVLTGLDIEAKADLTVRSLADALGGTRTVRRVRRPPHPHRQGPTRRPTREATRPAAGDGQGRGRRARWAGGSPTRPPSWPWPATPGFHLTVPAGRAPPPTASTGPPWCPPTWWCPAVVPPDGPRVEVPHHGHRADRRPGGRRPGPTPRSPRGDRRPDGARPPAGTAPGRDHRAPAARHDHRGPVGRQGRQRQRRPVGPVRRGLGLARRRAHAGPVPRSCCPRRTTSSSTARASPTCGRSTSWSSDSSAKAWPRPPGPIPRPRAWASTCGAGRRRPGPTGPRLVLICRRAPPPPGPRSAGTGTADAAPGGQPWTSPSPTSCTMLREAVAPSPPSSATGTSSRRPTPTSAPTSCGTRVAEQGFLGRQRARGVRRGRRGHHRAGRRGRGAGGPRLPAAGHRGVARHLRHHHRQVRHRGPEAAVAAAASPPAS